MTPFTANHNETCNCHIRLILISTNVLLKNVDWIYLCNLMCWIKLVNFRQSLIFLMISFLVLLPTFQMVIFELAFCFNLLYIHLHHHQDLSSSSRIEGAITNSNTSFYMKLWSFWVLISIQIMYIVRKYVFHRDFEEKVYWLWDKLISEMVHLFLGWSLYINRLSILFLKSVQNWGSFHFRLFKSFVSSINRSTIKIVHWEKIVACKRMKIFVSLQ